MVTRRKTSLKSRAKNNQKAGFSFENRKIYKEDQFIIKDNSTEPIDLWYDKPYYGIVNHLNQPVYVSPKYLKQISSDEGDLYALNFVANAFEDFKSIFLRERAMRRVVETGSGFLDMNPAKAWEPSRNIYSDYLRDVYAVYINQYYPNNKRAKGVETFEDFVNNFMEFVEDSVIGAKSPFTLSSFLMNKTVSPLASGLVIELAEDDHSDDLNKSVAYIRDPNFIFYKGLAKKYGFRLDKNAPWRLIADLSSPAMRQYMLEYKINSVSEMFDNLYVKTIEEDYDLLKEFFIKAYQVFVPSRPYERTAKYCPESGTTKSVFKRKVPATQEEIESTYGNDFWTKIYFDVRLMETKTHIPKAKYNIVLNNALRMQRVLDNRAVLRYIDEYVKLYDPTRS